MLDIALIVITLTTTGEARLSVTEAVSLQACEQVRTTVVGVLAQRKTEIIAARCAANQLALSPYRHGVPPVDYQHQYKVTLLAGQDYVLEYVPPSTPCVANTEQASYCVTASQAPLSSP